MSNVVRTWKDEANLAGEIELTDAQLEAVCGAQGDGGFVAQQEKHSSETITKKVVFFSADVSIQKNEDEKASIAAF